MITVTLACEKDEASGGGDDTASFKNVRVLSGNEASALLAGMPVYPHSAETTLTVTTSGAREAVINDPAGTLANSFGDVKWYIIPGIAAFSYPSFAYHIQGIKVPDGYEYDLSSETYISEDGGVTEFVVTKV